jgi:aspartate/methionine/tyrosine aminotransferase
VQSACIPESKLPKVGTTIFSVIGQLAEEHHALNLSQGAPNFACDPKLIEGVERAMRAGHNQYSPMSGVFALREAIAVKTQKLYGAQYDPDTEITVVASASEGLYATISALVHPGDEVIYFEPSFDSYAPIVQLQGATPVAIKLSPETFHIDWDEVAAAITPRTRMILVNTPHNPTGSAFTSADIERLTALTRDTKIVVLSDEVYEHVVFDGGTQRDRVVVRQVVSRHGLARRLLSRAGAADGRDPQDPPVHDLLRRYADANGFRRSTRGRSELSESRAVLSAQARPARRIAEAIALRTVAERGQFLHAGAV